MSNDLPPSALFVRYALAKEGPMTAADIQEETGLPERTVYDALDRLTREGHARSRRKLFHAHAEYALAE